MKLAILDDYQRVALRLADWSPLSGRVEVSTFHTPFATLEGAAAALREFDILCAMRERQAFPRSLIERLPNLKLLVTAGSRNAAIDVAAARESGVVVSGTTNGPGRRATAELTFGLILATLRHIAEEDRALRQGYWQTALGTMAYGKTLGLIGLGHVGAFVASFANAFGMRVLAWSANLTPARAAEQGARAVERDILLSESDIVSIHTVLSDRTRGLIGQAELERMKRSAILVNTSRGPVVDAAALVAALDSGTIARAALDVYDLEPLPLADDLRRLEGRALLTPHLGYATDEVYRIFYGDMVEAVVAFLAGTPIRLLQQS